MKFVKVKQAKINGYFTIEAALLMPMVLLLLLFVMLMGFVEYNRCIAEQEINMGLLLGSNMSYKSKEQISEFVVGRLIDFSSCCRRQWDENKLRVSNDKISLEWKGSIDFCGYEMLKRFNQKGILGGSYELDRYRPIQFIRTCRKVVHDIDRIRE